MDDPRDLDQLARTLARLERELGMAGSELARLRAERDAARPEGVSAQAPEHPAAGASAPRASAADPPRPAPPPRQDDHARPRPRPAGTGLGAGLSFEDFVGRYGALALAVLTIVMGAGALVSWALRQGLLTPLVRVLLGSLLAAVLAVAGMVLRSRDSRQFGHTLLALSLAVVHVVAWGAGPQLGLVPAWVSLAIADAASLALSVLALRDDSEQLFAVGVGGALLAPFVQRSGVDNYMMLATYGIVVSTAALRTMAARTWRLAAGIVVLAVFAYSLVLTGYHGGAPWLNRELAAGFVLILAAAALLLLESPLRPWIALALIAIGAVTGGPLQPPGDTALAILLDAPDVLLVAMVGTALAFFTARRMPERTEWWGAAALALPLLFLARAMFELVPARGGAVGGWVHASVAGVWVLGYAAAAMGERGVRRGALLAAAGVVATWAAVLAVDSWPSAIPASCAVVAMVTAWVARREAQPVALVGTAVAAAYGFSQGMLRLFEVYGFRMPFTTGPSVSLALGMAGLLVAVQLVPNSFAVGPGSERSLRDVALAVFATACFLWWRTELSRAFSADAAMFLLIVYYAGSGVLVLWRGRVAGSQGLRQTGLALSVWAALVALGGAFEVQQIALRVGSYLAVGAFLLGVAWWYRAATPATDEPGGP